MSVTSQTAAEQGVVAVVLKCDNKTFKFSRHEVVKLKVTCVENPKTISLYPDVPNSPKSKACRVSLGRAG